VVAGVLVHVPQEAKAASGEALPAVAGVERTTHYIEIDLPYSGDCFVPSFPAEAESQRTEMRRSVQRHGATNLVDKETSPGVIDHSNRLESFQTEVRP
jgi:hypothetical protein